MRTHVIDVEGRATFVGVTTWRAWAMRTYVPDVESVLLASGLMLRYIVAAFGN